MSGAGERHGDEWRQDLRDGVTVIALQAPTNMDKQQDTPPSYKHIERNEFVHRKHKKQKEEDIAICDCRYEENDIESACGDGCLNVLTSTECTPGYCPCGVYCKNQKFQKCEYAKVKLFRTNGRGWGLLANEIIKAGQFVIEYCGEVISWKAAKRRSLAYEATGLKDAFIISLNANESIDATKKGSLARFINHSCQSNCETRKWTVLGEIRVGIFAKQEILPGTELSYDYNFEWYGGAVVRCLCGASCCSGFLGAKSRGFQEATYVWEDNDDRYSVEKVPLYDSEEDELVSVLKNGNLSESRAVVEGGNDFSAKSLSLNLEGLQSEAISVEPLNCLPAEEMTDVPTDIEAENGVLHCFAVNTPVLGNIQGNSSCENDLFPPNSLRRRQPSHVFGKSRNRAKKEINARLIAEHLAWKDRQDELLAFEESKIQAMDRLNTTYDEIRPTIEEHERDNQDSVPTSIAEKWIEARCCSLKADFDLYSSVVKNVMFTPRRKRDEVPHETSDNGDGTKFLEMC